MKKISKIFTTTLIFIAIFVFAALGTYTLLNNYDLSSTKDIKTQFLTLKENMPRAYVVQSGSMEPAIPTGALIFSLPQKNYRSGEILTFENGNRLITHRAMYQEYTLEDSYFVTKGDANEEADANRVSQSQVVGKVVFSVPYVGYLADYAKTPQGFILFVIVPATIVIYEELKSLLKELLKFIKRMKDRFSSSSALDEKDVISSGTLAESRKLAERNNEDAAFDLDLLTRRFARDDNNTDSMNDFGSKLIKGVAILPIFGAVLVVAAFSVSYFFDNEVSPQNVFSASDIFDEGPTPTPDPNATPTPTPNNNPNNFPSTGKIVINEVYYDPDDDHKQPANADENLFEWIEIYNADNQTIDLKDWKVRDNSGTDRTVSTSQRLLAPGEFALLSRAANVFTLWDEPNDVLIIPLGEIFGNGLANTGDIVRLLDAQGSEIDSVSWGTNIDAFDPSVPGVVEGHSIERDPDGTDTDTAADFVDRDIPTPGN